MLECYCVVFVACRGVAQWHIAHVEPPLLAWSHWVVNTWFLALALQTLLLSDVMIAVAPSTRRWWCATATSAFFYGWWVRLGIDYLEEQARNKHPTHIAHGAAPHLLSLRASCFLSPPPPSPRTRATP